MVSLTVSFRGEIVTFGVEMDSPRSPLVPGIPGIPGGPMTPFIPFSPLIPGGPMIPCFPLFPGGPIIPWDPFLPFLPLSPLGPALPGGPGRPRGHTFKLPLLLQIFHVEEMTSSIISLIFAELLKGDGCKTLRFRRRVFGCLEVVGTTKNVSNKGRSKLKMAFHSLLQKKKKNYNHLFFFSLAILITIYSLSCVFE